MAGDDKHTKKFPEWLEPEIQEYGKIPGKLAGAEQALSEIEEIEARIKAKMNRFPFIQAGDLADLNLELKLLQSKLIQTVQGWTALC